MQSIAQSKLFLCKGEDEDKSAGDSPKHISKPIKRLVHSDCTAKCM